MAAISATPRAKPASRRSLARRDIRKRLIREAKRIAHQINDVLKRRISFSVERSVRVRVREVHVVQESLEAWFVIPTRLPRRVFVTDLMDAPVTQEIEVITRRPVRVAALANGAYCYVVSLRPLVPFPDVLRYDRRWDLPGRIVFGRDQFGKVLHMPLSIGHLLIAGMTRSGKSTALHHIIHHLALSPMVDLKLIDLKRTELPRHAARASATAWSAEDALDLLCEIHADVDRRNKQFAERGCRGIEDWNRQSPGEALPYVVVIVDETPALLMTEKIGKKAAVELTWLAGIARSAGYCLIISSQQVRRDVFPRALLMNLEHRFVFRVADKFESNLLLAATGIYATALDPGHALVRIGSSTMRVQVPLMPDL